MGKIQLPSVGGIRKVVKTGEQTTPGTTIAEIGAGTVTLAQLASVLSQIQAQQQNNGGGNIGAGDEGSISLGPGLSGGGPLVGNIPIRLTAPIPWFDGGDGGDGDPGPPGASGFPGLNGATGSQGPIGAAIFMAADDGPEGDAIPGPAGPAGPGSSLTITDGTHTVTGTTQITVSGGTIGGSTPNATLTIIAATTAVPGTIGDLVYWWTSSGILSSAGQKITRLPELTPWYGGTFAANGATVTTVDSSQLNGLNVLKFPPQATAGTYTISNQSVLSTAATFFVVVKPTSTPSAAGQAIIGGAGNSLAFYLNTASGGSVFALVKTGAAVIGTSSASWTTGTWVQVNATYISGTGAFAFRQARAAAGSGTGTTLAGTGATQFVGADSAAGTDLLNSASLAEIIIYNRVLTAGEITSVETYLNTKWGV